MPFQLPYPGYSWSMNQHVGRAAQPIILFELLQSAHIYKNQPNYEHLINKRIIDKGLLPENIRADAGRSQIWRDYQQILPELGIIVSTRFTNKIEISTIGLMWLDGAIGYSEMITTQCLSYQYPNGHKQDLSPAVKNSLRGAGLTIPRTRTELDAQMGILIKPAVLILRVLIELYSKGDANPTITVEECLAALVPTKKNSEWPGALQRLEFFRNFGMPPYIDARTKRHVQEWFRLLSLSDIFELSFTGRTAFLGLKNEVKENILEIKDLCAYHENPTTFWIYSNESYDTKTIAHSWFAHYGNPTIDSQWFMPEELQNDKYVEDNYLEGIETEDTVIPSQEDVNSPNFSINLREFQSNKFVSNPRGYNFDAGRIILGHQRRQRSSRLHEEIAEFLAKKLQKDGYSVSMDRQSVDILASKNNQESILEVKTINRKNWVQRFRLGVGQLSEYRYRRQLQVNHRPKSILVISSSYRFPEWMIDYFQNEVNVGLVSHISSGQFCAYTSGDIERVLEKI